MKYNDNGEYKDIYIKTFDTLPVGTEVDYDGETIPDGWSEVNNILYSNTSGTTGNVALSDNPTNYKYLDIFYVSDGVGHSTRMDTSKTSISLYGVAGNGTDMWEKMSLYSISGNNLNFTRSFKRDTTISSGNANCATSTTASYLSIFKVVGYK